jgi:hypothetical protein
MPVPQLLSDVVSVLLLLAPSAALLSLVLAGISLRREGGSTFIVGGGFTKWMFWAVMFATLRSLLGWFNTFGVGATLPSGGVSTSWLASFQSDISTFVSNFVMARIVPTLAAFFVLRAVLDVAGGGHPFPSLITAMFLLGAPTTFSLIQSYDTGTPFATVDVLDSLWTHFAGVIAPSAAALAVIGAVINFATRRPWVRLIFVALAFLCVSALWKLVQAMET